MKICSKCKENKESDLFYDCPSRKDGKRSECIECTKASQKKWSQEHAEIVSQRRKDKRAADPEYFRKANKASRDRTKEDRRKRDLETRAEHIKIAEEKRSHVSEKWCPKCKSIKSVEDFTFDYRRPDGCKSWCRSCQAEYSSKRRPEYRERKNESARVSRAALRIQVLRHYSADDPYCACCGEDALEFLSVDHIDGGGTQHKKKVRHVYKWIRDNDFPEGFRVLCHNCNQSLGAYGYCPHEKERDNVAQAA